MMLLPFFFGIYLYFGACILVFGIIVGGQASPLMKLRQNGTVFFPIKLDVKRPAVVLNLEPIGLG